MYGFQFNYFVLLFFKQLAFISFCISLIFFYSYKTKKFAVIDLFWPLGFVFIALQMLFFNPINDIRLLVARLIFVWALRLELHLLLRHAKRHGDDPRYQQLFLQFAGPYQWVKAYVYIFLMQACALCIISLSIISLFFDYPKSNSWNVYLGLLVWTIGFCSESIADFQLSRHLNDTVNKGKLLTTGIWRYSRHPNYFGEILVWWGIWLICLQSNLGLLTIVSPLLITFVLIWVTGIPPAEAAMEKLPDFKAYAQKTSVLIPWFVKK